MKRIITLVLSLFFIHQFSASAGDIRGKVIDQNSHSGIPGVHVYLDGSKKGSFTDGQGRFLIDNVSTGKHTIKLSAIGYKPVSREITVGEEETGILEFSLMESVEMLESVIIDRVSMIGGSANIKDIPGSAHYISRKELNKFNHSDVNRILRNIPGLIIQEEDGFGLRPNIGMRGTGVERSSKITIMEDGILMAPAPYAAPSAYYFPSAGRMSSIEVRKGSSQIKYGPNTTGGAINFFSTYLPEDYVVNTEIIAGNYGYKNIHAYAGKSFQNGGLMAETFILNSDGFKDLDNGGNTGFIKEDYMLKGRINTNPDARIYQALNFKVGSMNENSNETYLGLARPDFEDSPYRRYSASQMDNMVADHTQWHLRHLIQPLQFLDVTTTFYRNDFSRNWYKLDKIKGTPDGEKVSISSILDEPSVYNGEYSIITGETSQHDDALFVKANNREYYSQGVESIIGLTFSSSFVDHEIEIGGRIHWDQMDRFQWVDEYRMADGIMQMTDKGIPGTESNYILDARAVSGFTQYKLDFDRLLVSAGLRYENIEFTRENFGKEDPQRTGSSLQVESNRLDIFIPGIGLDYDIMPELSMFAGVHKGFSPPGSKEGTNPEISVNYETGLRYSTPFWHINSTFYFNDYSNLLGSDLAAAGGSGTVDQFNGGESRIFGVEQEITYELAQWLNTAVSMPLSVNYTYTNASFSTDFESEYGPWGTVKKGDKLPYVPEHQFAVNLGVYYKRFGIDFSSKYSGNMRAVAGQGTIPEDRLIDSYYVSDIAVNFKTAGFLNFYGGVFNVFDNVYEVSNRPAGLRPGMPRNFRFGVKAFFNN